MNESERPLVVAVEKKESIRQWYQRTTRSARKVVIYGMCASVLAIVVMGLFSSFGLLARIQTANGALTIPLIGGIWIFAFIFMFLIPSREASFRGQETLERGVDILKQTIDEKLGPAADVWMRVGKKVEAEFPAFLAEAKATLAEAREAIRKVDVIAQKNDYLANHAKPAIDTLRRIEVSVEREINSGMLDEIRDASRAVREMTGLPPMEKADSDLGWAINKAKTGAKA